MHMKFRNLTIMVIKTLIKLDKKSIEKLKEICRIQIFSIGTPLFYQGHIPMVGYLVIDGSINLIKNKKIKSTVRAGGVIGVKELFENTPSSVTAEVTSNTTICYIDRSTVQDLIKNNDLELANLFQNLFMNQAS